MVLYVVLRFVAQLHSVACFGSLLHSAAVYMHAHMYIVSVYFLCVCVCCCVIPTIIEAFRDVHLCMCWFPFTLGKQKSVLLLPLSFSLSSLYSSLYTCTYGYWSILKRNVGMADFSVTAMDNTIQNALLH